MSLKPLDLSNLLKHAWLHGNVRDSNWIDYDPNQCPAFARINNALAQAEQPVAYLSGIYREFIEGRRDRVPLGAEVSFVNLNWPGQIPLYAQPPAKQEVGETAPAPVQHVMGIEWHRMIDGDPKEIGRYIVGHRAISVPAIFYPEKGWNIDVSAFTHWAKEPHAPDDRTPSLARQEGRQMRQDNDQAAAWGGLAAAIETPAPVSREAPSDALALARRVANLNPDAGEIGEGMLRSLVEDARRIVE